ncbi:MauE/DoxX family redox-associated membrane protein [Nonomuraea cavernae]|uniref:MauE/DoxX family redox-associated membrane protein n=1 Tax=Nonomuraea cavernae TaxID=2045107 RepID=UPI001E51F48C|nr:MauE/DoxX family redox-associated membrane protein [Nonomuraea cavernae]
MLLTFPLSGILLWAGLEKLRERGQFMGTLAQLGFAGRAGSLLAVAVPVAEIVTGAGLVLVPSATWPVASVAGLGVLFAVAGLLALRTGRNITCSCLGAGGSMLGRRQIGLLPAWLGVAAALYLLAPDWPAAQGIQSTPVAIVVEEGRFTRATTVPSSRQLYALLESLRANRTIEVGGPSSLEVK